MKIVLIAAIGAFTAISAFAVDITAVVRAANAATLRLVEGVPYNEDNPVGVGNTYGAGCLFDGNYGGDGRWICKTKPTEDDPITVEYAVNRNLTVNGRFVKIVVKSFSLHLTCSSGANREKRMPTVFSLQASRDGASWTTLYAVDPSYPVNNWKAGTVEVRKFEIPEEKQGCYWQYRFVVTANNGYTDTMAQELVLDGDLVPLEPLAGSADVFSDASFHFRGARDMNHDGVFQPEEFIDARYLGDPTRLVQPCSVEGPSTNVRLCEETVVAPYRGGARSGVSVLHFDQPSWFPDETGASEVALTGYVKIPGELPVTNAGPFTAVLRLKCDGLLDPNNSYNRVANFGYDRATTSGFSLMFEKLGNKGQLIPRIAFGANASDQPRFGTDENGFMISTNEWVDLAVTLGEGKINVYWCGENDCLMAMEKPLPDGLGSSKYLSEILLGGHIATEIPKSNKDDWGVFRGSIAQFAVWGRCLSQDEILQAFGSPRPDLWRMGVSNGSSVEFGDSARATTVDTADDCRLMPAWLTPSTPEAQVSFTVDDAFADRLQVLRILTTARSESGKLSAAIGTWKSSVISFDGADEILIDIPATCLGTGEKTLVLKHESGGELEFDSLSLGGSLQIGDENGGFYQFTRTANHGVGGYDFCSGNPAEVLNYATPFGERPKLSNVVVRVCVPAALASRQYRFSAQFYQTYSETPVPVSVRLNGVILRGLTLAQRTATDCVIPKITLNPGVNVFELVHDGEPLEGSDNAAVRTKFFALDVMPKRPGFVFILSAIGGVW